MMCLQIGYKHEAFHCYLHKRKKFRVGSPKINVSPFLTTYPAKFLYGDVFDDKSMAQGVRVLELNDLYPTTTSDLTLIFYFLLVSPQSIIYGAGFGTELTILSSKKTVR